MASPFKPDVGERLVARVLRDVLAREQFESFGDLKAALLKRCGGLGIACPVDVVDRALDLVGTNHPMLAKKPSAAKPVEFSMEASAISRTEAAAILRRLRAQVGQTEEAAQPATSAAPEHFPQLVRVP